MNEASTKLPLDATVTGATSCVATGVAVLGLALATVVAGGWSVVVLDASTRLALLLWALPPAVEVVGFDAGA